MGWFLVVGYVPISVDVQNIMVQKHTLGVGGWISCLGVEELRYVCMIMLGHIRWNLALFLKKKEILEFGTTRYFLFDLL